MRHATQSTDESNWLNKLRCLALDDKVGALDELFTEILRELAVRFDSRATVLYRVDRPRQLLRLWLCKDHQIRSWPRSLHLEESSSLAAKAVQLREPQQVADALTDPAVNQLHARLLGLAGAFLVVPLIVDDECIAAFGVNQPGGSPAIPTLVSEDVKSFLSRVEGALAHLPKSSAIYEMARVCRAFREVDKVSTSIESSEDLDGILKFALDAAQKLVPDATWVIKLVDQKRNLLIRHAQSHEDEDLAPKARPLHEGVAGQAGIKGSPVVISDLQDYRPFKEYLERQASVPGNDPYVRVLRHRRHEMSVPVFAGLRVVGVIDAHRSTNRPFADAEDRSDARRIEHLALRLGPQIAHALSIQREREVQQIIQALIPGMDLPDLLATIRDQLSSFFHAKDCCILGEAEYAQIVKLPCRKPGKHECRRCKLRERGILEAVRKTRTPRLCTGKFYGCEKCPDHENRSDLAVPLMVDQTLIGFLTMETDQPAYFDNEDLRLISSFIAPPVAMAIKRAIHDQERARTHQRLQKAVGDLLKDLGRFAPNLFRDDLAEIQSRIGDTIRKEMRLRHKQDVTVSIALRPEISSRLEAHVNSERFPNGLEAVNRRLGQPDDVARRVLDAGQAILDYRKPVRPGHALLSGARFSHVFVPLGVPGHWVGVLGIEAQDENAVFTEADRDLLSELAQVLSPPVLLAEWKTMFWESLARSMRMAELGTLLTGTAHELGNYIGAIQAYLGTIELILNSAGLKERAREPLDGIQNRITAFQTYVNEFRNYAGAGTLERSRLDLVRVINGCRLTIGYLMTKEAIQVDIDLPERLPYVAGNGAEMRFVLLNLLNNAVRSITSSGRHPRTIRISASSTGAGSIEIRVTDSGGGLTPETLSVFNAFFATGYHRPPIGLGLLLVYVYVVDRQKGKVEVFSEAGKGATFAVTIPAERE